MYVYVCMYVCMHVCMYVCMYMYVYYELPCMYVCVGLIDYLMSSDPGAKVLRDHIIFKIGMLCR